MNGSARFLRTRRPAPAPMALAALSLALAGCADVQRAMETPRVNPESPVAAEVAAGMRQSYPTPYLRDVPPVPRNLPQAGEVKAAVANLVDCRRAMHGYVLDHPPLSGQPEFFDEDLRALAVLGPADVPPPDSAARSAAYAEQLRQFAAPPTAIAGGPPPTPAEGMPPAPGAPAAVKPSAAARPRTTPAVVPPSPPATAAPTYAASPVAAPAAVEPASAAPPLPAPLPDPLLSRCA